VLNNFRKHQAQQGKLAPRSARAAAQASTTAGAIIDRFSSAIAGAPIVRARTWLLHQAQLR
ncbi:MAG: hypothetical protein ACHQ17_06965, partial [Polyangia bacterium]